MPRALRIVTPPAEPPPHGHVTLDTATRLELAAIGADLARIRGLEHQPTHATVRRALASIPEIRERLDRIANGLARV